MGVSLRAGRLRDGPAVARSPGARNSAEAPVRRSASKRGTAGTPGPDAPGFAEEARRQAALLRGDPHEAEVLEWIEQVADRTDWT